MEGDTTGESNRSSITKERNGMRSMEEEDQQRRRRDTPPPASRSRVTDGASITELERETRANFILKNNFLI